MKHEVDMMKSLKFTLFALQIIVLSGCFEATSNPDRKTQNPPGTNPDGQTRPITGDRDLSLCERSKLIRANGKTPLCVAVEREAFFNGTLGDHYFLPIPQALWDYEQRVITAQAAVSCGTAKNSSILERSRDCAAKNTELASLFRSELQGVSSEKNWALVAALSDNVMWQKIETKMVFGPLTRGVNYYEAQGLDHTNKAMDACDSSQNPILSNSFDISNIKFRAPTRGDLLQADLDGMRFLYHPILEDTEEFYVWTSLLNKDNTAQAYDLKTGQIRNFDPATKLNALCISYE